MTVYAERTKLERTQHSDSVQQESSTSGHVFEHFVPSPAMLFNLFVLHSGELERWFSTVSLLGLLLFFRDSAARETPGISDIAEKWFDPPFVGNSGDQGDPPSWETEGIWANLRMGSRIGLQETGNSWDQ